MERWCDREGDVQSGGVIQPRALGKKRKTGSVNDAGTTVAIEWVLDKARQRRYN